jgi:hypothetical protein
MYRGRENIDARLYMSIEFKCDIAATSERNLREKIHVIS